MSQQIPQTQKAPSVKSPKSLVATVVITPKEGSDANWLTHVYVAGQVQGEPQEITELETAFSALPTYFVVEHEWNYLGLTFIGKNTYIMSFTIPQSPILVPG